MVKPDFIQMEHDILDLWEREGFQKKLMKRNENGPVFRFLDGPITANNPMGVHHAWGRSIKDIMLRYKGMTGHSCHYRNGFDGQGLWVEVEVEKELGFEGKRDIETYGMDKFTRRCVERVNKFSKIITEQSKRLGQWMDWDNSYYTNSDENIEGIWHFLKVCDERGWITTENRPMPWCPRCGTSLSEHEMTGSHKEVTHIAVFVRVPVLGKDFDILVWTTTPWTLSANIALAVNPEMTYVKILTDDSPRPLVLAKTSLGWIDGKKNVIETLKGEDLVGLRYESILPMLPVQQTLEHKVVPWDEVAADEGSGVVHIAPGCGAEDFELGRSLGLAEVCPIDESGRFYDNYDFLSGLTAADAAQPVFDKLKELGKLYKTHAYTHMYPVCWRCKSQVLFRLVEEWYIKTDEIRPQLIRAAEGVQWDPPYIGKRMMDWLNNMGDWNISRKRYYGLPLPFYVCPDCGKVTVVGSKKELKELGGGDAVDALPELHRPWIDEITINCPSCGAKVHRIPSVGDVWLDAGITPFSTNKYFSDRAYWEKQFPAQWVTEMREQVRLWFYSILFMSVTLTGRAPYERVLAYNSVVSEDGTRFSKTGFMIRFDEAAERIGADAIRYLYAGANVAADVRFGFNLGDEARRKMLGLWNIYTFFETYAEIDKPVIGEPMEYDNLSDRWLTSRVADFVREATKNYEAYNTSDTVRAFELCVDDVSNWYVRTGRRRFWKEGEDSDKQQAYTALFYAIRNICGVMAPIIPFMTEYIWQNMVRKYRPSSEESVHLAPFPTPDAIDTALLEATAQARDVIATALKLRNERQIKVRQPLSTLYLHASTKDALAPYLATIRDELNIKSIEFVNDASMLEDHYLQLNLRTAGRVLKGDAGKVKGILDTLSDADMDAATAQQAAGQPVTLPGYDNPIDAELFNVLAKTKEHIAAHTTDKVEELVAIDATITDELRAEGYYRDLLRNLQVLRREAGFRVDDRVRIAVSTDAPELNAVLSDFRESFERETLSTFAKIEKSVLDKEVEIGDFRAVLSIEKA